jgi:hypothetical protein
MKKVIILMFLCSLFACQEKEPVFTLVENEKSYYKGNRCVLYNYFLVENTPKDTMELKRLMIYHFSELVPAIEMLQEHSDTDYVRGTFFKSTRATRKRFSYTEENRRGETYMYPGLRNSFGWYNDRTLIGSLLVERCEKDAMKLIVEIRVNVGATSEDEFPNLKIITLLNECDTIWYEANKNNDLVKYFQSKLTTNH